jgi:hypothetical protein
MGKIRDLREQQRNNVLGRAEVQASVTIGVDGVEYG